MVDHAFDPGGNVAADIRSKYGYDGDLAAIYTGLRGVTAHKWHHYIPIYDQYFSRFRGSSVKFLEIGVNMGGSLRMWRQFLGEAATIYGIDINENCAVLDGQSAQVRIGSQDDPVFLAGVIEEMGGIDVVLDDGSHRMQHVRASLEILFPRLNPGGIYMIEDLHTAYWHNFGGGQGAPGNFFDFVRGLIDDMHRWYHDGAPIRSGLAGAVSGIHVHDSIVVFDKQPVHPPCHSIVGSPA